MRLTDNEIRDINRYREEGKPLPERFRFLLFEDKREVELVWNGKTAEVCNIVLPFQVIEQVDEPRTEEALKAAPTLLDMQTSRQIKGWNNKLIWGDESGIIKREIIRKHCEETEEYEEKWAGDYVFENECRVVAPKKIANWN